MDNISSSKMHFNAKLARYLGKIKTDKLTMLGKLQYNDFYITDEIKFYHDVWDFNYLNKNYRMRSNYLFDFSNIDNRYKVYCKKVVITVLLYRENSYSYAKQVLLLAKNFMIYLKENMIWYGESINIDLVKKYIDKRSESVTGKSMGNYILHLGILLAEIESVHSILNYNDIIEYLKIRGSYFSGIEGSRQEGKTEMIPLSIYNKTISLAIKDINNESISMQERMAACMIVILSETGMRVEELTLLEHNKLSDIVLKDGKTATYLNFKTFKTIRSTSEGSDTQSVFYETSKFAYNKLCEFARNIIDNLTEKKKLKLLLYIHTAGQIKLPEKISELRKMVLEIPEQRINQLLDISKRFLFINPVNGRKFYVSQDVFRYELKKFYFRHQNDFNFKKLSAVELNEMNIFTIDSKSKLEQFRNTLRSNNKEVNMGQSFYYVTPHMFRVTVCTILFRKLGRRGLQFIMKHMNHLTPDMTILYNRNDKYKQSVEIGLEVLKNIATKEGLLELNPENVDNEIIKMDLYDPNKKVKYELVNEFLKVNKINVVKDVDKLIKLVERANSPIFENEFGVCVRAAIHGICERQISFNQIDDYLHIGIKIPNIKNLHFTYRRFLEKVKIITRNEEVVLKQPKYSTELSRQKRAMKIFIGKLLLPELNLANDKVNDLGLEQFNIEFPHLKFLSYRLNTIIQLEVSKWMS